MMTQQAGPGGMTKAAGPAPAAAAPQRSDRPKPERSERPGANTSSSNNAALRTLDDINDPLSANPGPKTPLAAPRVGPASNRTGAPQNRGAKAGDEEDDFGDTDVGSLLV